MNFLWLSLPEKNVPADTEEKKEKKKERKEGEGDFPRFFHTNSLEKKVKKSANDCRTRKEKKEKKKKGGGGGKRNAASPYASPIQKITF